MAEIGQIASYDSSLIVAYRAGERPTVVYDDLSHDWRENRVERYVEGAYLLDPFYLAAMDAGLTGLHRLRDLAPDRFQQSEYFKSYYGQSQLNDELSYLFPAEGGAVLSVCLGRRQDHPRFGKRDIERLNIIAPVVEALTVRHWKVLLSKPATSAATGLDARLQAAFSNFGRSVLTPRECDVVQLLLRGHSSRSIGEKLDITRGTVKIHRHNIYEKLDISTQSELFYMFLDALSTGGVEGDQDPLAQYL